MVAITLEDSALEATATTSTSLDMDLTTIFPLGPPQIGELVLISLERALSDGAVSEATGDWNLVTPNIGTATVKGTLHFYWRQIDGEEEDDYTWTFASSTRRAVFYRVSNDIDGGLWVFDCASPVYPGSNTVGTSQQINATPTLAEAVEFVVASLVLAAGTGHTTPSISDGFTRVFGANTPMISGYQITPDTDPLQPTFTWAALTNRAKAVGGSAAFKVVAPVTESISDDLDMSDNIAPVLLPYDPEKIFNFVPDMKWGEDQVYKVYRGEIEVWDWLSRYPFYVEVGNPGEYWKFVVPPGCEEIAFDSGGGRGGAGAGQGVAGDPGGSIGGAGSRQAGILSGLVEGDILEGYVARAGGAGNEVGPYGLTSYGIGGEPGGAGSAMNIYNNEYRRLGCTGGGLTSIWKNGELMLATAGGGGGAGDNPGKVGGNGGAGGGDTGQAGADGVTTGGPTQKGFGAGGGTQSAGGAGGVGSALSNGPGDGQAGNYLAGGSTFRRGAFGTGLTPHSCGGGGGAGLWGGGGGGNGTDPTLVSGSGGGGGGGSDGHDDDDVEITTQVQGGNTGDDGYLTFLYQAKRTHEVPTF